MERRYANYERTHCVDFLVPHLLRVWLLRQLVECEADGGAIPLRQGA